jgi:hypothetical protein
VLSRIFQRTELEASSERHSGISLQPPAKILRHSSGWSMISARLRKQEGLSILDVGPTSHRSINFLTDLGHSVFMSDLVEESSHPEWNSPGQDQIPSRTRISDFIDKHMQFGTRVFDVVLLWDTLNYLPEPFVAPVLRRLQDCMVSDGEMLAFFHTQPHRRGSNYYRYHLVDAENVEVQEYTGHALLHTYQVRAIERLFADFRSCRFFLAKDNLSEVIVLR